MRLLLWLLLARRQPGAHSSTPARQHASLLPLLLLLLLLVLLLHQRHLLQLLWLLHV
jgi:hypothetical protein